MRNRYRGRMIREDGKRNRKSVVGRLVIIQDDGNISDVDNEGLRKYIGTDGEGKEIYQGRSDNQCAGIKGKGDRCKNSPLPGSDYCIVHYPRNEGINEQVKNILENKKAEYEAEREWNETEWGKRQQELNDINIKVINRERDLGNIEYQVRELSKSRESLKNNKREFIESVAGIERLEEIYQIAKLGGDASTMEKVNKSMYYAKRNLKRKHGMLY